MAGELPNAPGEWNDKIFNMEAGHFNQLALEAYSYQYSASEVYGKFADAVGRPPAKVKLAKDIPFLPISFFKTHTVTSGVFTAQSVFESSGTTTTVNSRHLVKDVSLYKQSFSAAFEQFYGPVNEWCILALLPSYLERSQSSLVMMAADLIRDSRHAASGFYLYDHEKLKEQLLQLEAAGQKTLLIGVTFALLDFADAYALPLEHTVVMETGGMKGRREEWTRQQVHDFLVRRLGTRVIHSEYGMTELLSQAYSSGNGIFYSPPWMRILLREEDDPFQVSSGNTGIINVIDLANIHSCCFIATDDAGRLHANGGFEITGRIDNADLRGCSLMTI